MPDEYRVLDMIGEDHEARSIIETQGIETVEHLAKRFGEVEKFIQSTPRGGIPKKDAAPEQWSEFYKQLGVPDSADGYEVEVSDAFKDRVDGLRKAAHEAHVTPEQFSAIASAADKAEQQRVESQRAELQQLHERFVEQGREQFGEEYEEVAAGAKRLMGSLTSEDSELSKYFDEKGYSSDPGILLLLSNAQKLIGDHQMPETTGSPEHMSAQDQTMKAAELIARGRAALKDDAYRNTEHPEYDAVRLEYAKAVRGLKKLGIGGMVDENTRQAYGPLNSPQAEDILRKARSLELED